MIDIKLVRENPKLLKESQKKRGLPVSTVDAILEADEIWKKSRSELEKLFQKRNETSQTINALKKAGQSIESSVKDMQKVNKKIADLEQTTETLKKARNDLLMSTPNILHESVPVGKDDTENEILREVGTKTQFASFTPRSHVDLLELLEVADIERAGKTSGARFYYLKNDLVKLDFALMMYGLDSLAKKGYTLFEPPYMLRRKAMEGCVDLSDFEEVLYKIEDEDLHLIATSEHALGSYHMDEIIEEQDLPLKYAGVSPCFRKEAGSHGKDTKGIFRVHQFNKIEQFIFCKPEDSWQIHEELLANAEEFYQSLKIPYRVVNICTGDIGSIAAKKYDIEAWMPAQNTYREVVSCSNCTDYQANRLNARSRASTNDPTYAVNTLNSTLVATGRTIVAILENFQLKDGSVEIPKVIQPYMGGQKRIETQK